MQAYSRANAARPAIASGPTPAGAAFPRPPRLPPGPGPLPRLPPADLPVPPSAPPRPPLVAARPRGRPLVRREVTHPAHSATRRLAGKLPYYCDAESGDTRSPARGTVTVGIPSGSSAPAKVRGAGAGVPGRRAPRSGLCAAAAFHGARLSARGARRGCCGGGASSTTWGRARGRRGRAPAVPAGHPRPQLRAPPWRSGGFALRSKEPPRPGRPEAA